MKIIAVNGSPRKQNNTATLLQKALDGAASVGVETKLVHLYDLTYTGCVSCFACKRLGDASFGRCAVRDDLTPVLEELHTADAIVVGTPLYLMGENGMTRSFLERFVFQYITYANPPATKYPKRIRSAMIYTMNISEDNFDAYGVHACVQHAPAFLERTLGSCETLLVSDTAQFDEYSKYENTLFDPAAKMKRRREHFPKDEENAFALGVRLMRPVETL